MGIEDAIAEAKFYATGEEASDRILAILLDSANLTTEDRCEALISLCEVLARRVDALEQANQAMAERLSCSGLE